MRVLSSEIFSCEDTFLLGFVSQHGSSHYVSDCQNVRDVGLEMIIDNNSSLLINFDSGSVKS